MKAYDAKQLVAISRYLRLALLSQETEKSISLCTV